MKLCRYQQSHRKLVGDRRRQRRARFVQIHAGNTSAKSCALPDARPVKYRRDNQPFGCSGSELDLRTELAVDTQS